MKNRFNKELAFNLIYLIPFYLANKLAQIFRLLQGGDFIERSLPALPIYPSWPSIPGYPSSFRTC